jgi:hypothetical protein
MLIINLRRRLLVGGHSDTAAGAGENERNENEKRSNLKNFFNCTVFLNFYNFKGYR